jgi:hypothetical protein
MLAPFNAMQSHTCRLHVKRLLLFKHAMFTCHVLHRVADSHTP